MLSKVPDRRQAPVLLHFLSLAIGAALLLPKLGTIPGPHGDEAWFGLRAHKIVAAGARPLGGMTPYTGPLYQYLLAPVMALGGYEVAALRSLGVAASLVAAHFYFLLVRRFFDPWTAALAVLTLVTTPFFQLEGRFALEVTALNPVLALGAGLLLARRRPASVFAAGLLARARRLEPRPFSSRAPDDLRPGGFQTKEPADPSASRSFHRAWFYLSWPTRITAVALVER